MKGKLIANYVKRFLRWFIFRQEVMERLVQSFFRKILTLERRLELTESSRSVSQEKFLDELRSVVTDSELSEKIVEIENQVAELEEEKGNLQLKLVEFEELAGKLSLNVCCIF